jgi:hypothetical protein
MSRPLGSKNRKHTSNFDISSVVTISHTDKRKTRTMTDSQKQAMQEGRRRAKAEKMGIELSEITSTLPLDKIAIKPIMIYSGKEEDFLDFSANLKAALNSVHRIKSYDDIATEMVQAGWSNPKGIAKVLEKYVILKRG